MYMVLENQPGFLTLLSVGTVATPWLNGEFLEVVGNRETVSNDTVFETSWQPNAITVADGPYAGNYAKFNMLDTTAEYSSENQAIVGAMEGIADLLPFYTDPEAVEAGDEARLGIDRPFRDQASRMLYSTEQAGGFVMQYENEHIIDSVVHEYPEKTIRLTLISCSPKSGSIPKALEHQQIRWVTRAEMDTMDFAPADRELIRKQLV
jgi:hypothetical protein